MVPTDEATQEVEGQAGQTSPATSQASQGSPPKGQRVLSTIPVGPVLEGITFGRLVSNPDVWCSVPIEDTRVVERLCSIPGFSLAAGMLSPEDEAALDDAYALSEHQARIAARAASEGITADPAKLRQTVEELTANNQAMAQELNETRMRLEDAERKLSGSDVVRLQRQIELLQQQVDQGGGASVALEQENERLRAEIAHLRGSAAA